MKNLAYMIYSLVCYLIFLLTFLYLIGFVLNIPRFEFVAPLHAYFPKSLDTGTQFITLFWAAIINTTLITLFGLQHSVMARPGFKQKWTRIVPKPIERSTYVLFASLSLIVLYYFWQPMPQLIWEVTQPGLHAILLALSIFGFLIVLVATFLINHFNLFGLRQVYLHAKGNRSQPSHLPFKTPLFYKLIRHPIYFGFLLAFWATPLMTLSHLIFSLGMTVYIFIGIFYEERDLLAYFGKRYQDYKKQVPKIIPFTKKKRTKKAPKTV